MHDVNFWNKVGNHQSYRISFKGLKEGKHKFEFEIDDSFFEKLEYSEITKGKLQAIVELNKKPSFLELSFKLNGFIILICDRCLDEYNQEVDYEGSMYVKFSETDQESDDEIIYISPKENDLDLSHYIYESIILSIPLKRVHPDDKNGMTTCNPEMIKKLKNYKTDEPADDGVDPRWDDLKNLMAN